eukprot:jgi/Ulvmu1/1325/UM011_0053.1
MVEFNKYMQESMNPDWKHAYLNYRMLKKQLGLLESYLEDKKTSDDSIIWLKLLFQRTLDGEIFKLVDFYNMRVAELKDTVHHLAEHEKELVLSVLNMKDVSPAIKIQVLQTYQDQWRACGKRVKHILEFVSLNLRALRKIVKKQNKRVGALEPGASAQLQATLEITHPHEGTVYRQGSFLKPEQVRAMEAMVAHAEVQHAHREVQARLTQAGAALRQLHSARSAAAAAPRPRVSGDAARPSLDGAASADGGSVVASSAADAEAGAMVARARAVATPIRTQTTRSRHDTYVERASERAAALVRWDSINPVPESPGSMAQDSVILEIIAAEADARRNAELIRPLEASYAVTAGIFEPAPAADRATRVGLWLNLLNVFLYMTNYNLVIPTIGPFCDKLGVPASTAGLVIGCADFMAILVAMGYSVWSNRTFKRPLLCASVVCAFGNLLVTLSYDTGGLALLLAGRLLTGAGNGRVLNRRYIADFVSLEGRTIASIAFVAASAAGMALGPFIAVPLTMLLGRYGDTWRVAGLTVNVITVEGWLMVVVWLLFFVIAALYFDEPLAPDAAEEEATAAAAADAMDGSVSQPLLPPPTPLSERSGGNGTEERAEAAAVDAAFDDPESSEGEAVDGAAAAAASAAVDPAAEADAASASAAPAAPSGDRAAAEGAMKTLAADGEAAAAPVWAHFAAVLREPSLLPTVACIVMLFLLKLLQQGSVSAVPVFTGDFYGWQQGTVGLFMTALSLAMIPVNFSVAALATLLSDRLLMGVSLVFCAVGCVAMVSLSGGAIPLTTYVVSVSLILSFTNVLEGVSMSVLSKVIHPSLARGTLNAGLLATQSGSLGRLVGNFCISVFGGIVVGTVALANVMFLSFAVFVVLCAVLFAVSYSRLRKQDG